MLPDGRYDVVIVDAADAAPAGAAAARMLSLDLAIAAGEHRGEVVSVNAPASRLGDPDPVDLLAMPATLVVSSGTPSVTLDEV